MHPGKMYGDVHNYPKCSQNIFHQTTEAENMQALKNDTPRIIFPKQ
jgi:hypothetical protein